MVHSPSWWARCGSRRVRLVWHSGTGSSHFISTEEGEGESEYEMNQDIKLQGLPPKTYVSSKVPSPVTSQKVPAAGDQAHMSLWGTFLTQITAKANLSKWSIISLNS